MGSDPKPESWGYGLTWLITIGLIAMVAFGTFKLTVTAKESSKHLEQAKKDAEKLGLAALSKQNAEVDKLEKADAEAASSFSWEDATARKDIERKAKEQCRAQRTRAVTSLAVEFDRSEEECGRMLDASGGDLERAYQALLARRKSDDAAIARVLQKEARAA